MHRRGNATTRAQEALRGSRGVALGSIGVLIFSFTFPATRLALAGFSPWMVGFGRGAVASVLAAVSLRGAARERERAHQPAIERARRETPSRS